MSLIVNEIFYSIQGESIYSGVPCIFVRLTGCNLRCSYCDTAYAYYEGVELSIEEILSKVDSYKCPLIEITGGEPLLQDDTPLLIDRLLEKKYEVLLETNGSININVVNNRCLKIVDIKCPSSDENDKNDLENLKRLNQKDQIKFVLGNHKDYEFAKETTKLIPPGFPMKNVLFSPLIEQMHPSQLAEWIIEDRLMVRLQIQLHKIIWPEKERGV
ncbi:MAG: radical SAM protein [Deltaproteobacteria bacterium]|nr:radical SAM protein [Deltaproteobacteria bacterium]